MNLASIEHAIVHRVAQIVAVAGLAGGVAGAFDPTLAGELVDGWQYLMVGGGAVLGVINQAVDAFAQSAGVGRHNAPNIAPRQ